MRSKSRTSFAHQIEYSLKTIADTVYEAIIHEPDHVKLSLFAHKLRDIADRLDGYVTLVQKQQGDEHE